MEQSVILAKENNMFGYININKSQLSEEERKAYQAYYCGLCRKLKTGSVNL